MSESQKLPFARCLSCQAQLDGATGIGDSGEKPVEGAISICMYCGHLAVYAADLSIRPMTQQERDELEADKPAWRIVQRAIEAIGNARERFPDFPRPIDK